MKAARVLLAIVFVLIFAGSRHSFGFDVRRDALCEPPVSSEEKCLIKMLPFKGRSFDDYIRALKEMVPYEELYQVLKHLHAAAVDSSGSGFDELRHYIYPEGVDVFGERQLFVNKMNAYLFWIAETMRDKGSILYPDVPEEYLLTAFHTLFAYNNNMYVDDAYDLDKIIVGHMFEYSIGYNDDLIEVIAHFAKADGNPELVRNYNTRVLIMLAVEFLRYIHRIFHINTASSAQWFIDNIPEISSGKVVELGAGNGLLSTLLKMKGVDITATDHSENIVKLARDSGNTVKQFKSHDAIKHFAEANVFLSVFPYGEMAYDIGSLVSRWSVTGSDQEWILIQLVQECDKSCEKSIDYYREYAHIDILDPPREVFKTMYASELNNKMIIYRKKEVNMRDPDLNKMHQEL